MSIKKFEVGKQYYMRSICDHDCVWAYIVIKRTNSTITLKSDTGDIKTCRINKRDTEYLRAETVKPLGSYSMCPILSADKIKLNP